MISFLGLVDGDTATAQFLSYMAEVPLDSDECPSCSRWKRHRHRAFRAPSSGGARLNGRGHGGNDLVTADGCTEISHFLSLSLQ